jgi:hypothetical protein
MTKDDASRRIQKLVSMAGELLDQAKELARDHSISFSKSSGVPFELKYDVHLDRWKVGDDYWQDSGCTIGYEDLDDSWYSSSIC